MAESMIVVRNIAGNVVAEFSKQAAEQESCSAPSTVFELKESLQAVQNVPIALQRLMLGETPLEDAYELGAESIDLTFVVDESAYFTWDMASNPDKQLLSGSGSTVCYESGRHDYVNVLTKEPVREGSHYFEFHMHKVGDEQWCGFTPHQERAGHRGEFAGGWFYYSGRRYSSYGELHAGHERKSVQRVEHVKDGDIIGIFLDLDHGVVAFTHNGKVQGACAIAKVPFYLSTSLDAPGDLVELRKPPVQCFPLDLNAVRAHPLSGGSQPAYTGWQVGEEPVGSCSDSTSESSTPRSDARGGYMSE